MEGPVEGTARVISRSDHSGRGIQDVCHLNLVVQAEGIEPTAVEICRFATATGGPIRR
jgi:hypothetical protein